MNLLPCPFCGSDNLTDIGSNVICINCGSCSSIWNTRYSPWISVKDRLPEEKSEVLIIHYTQTYIGHLRKCSLGDLHFITYDGPCLDFDNVTHWMPLPLLPEDNQ